MELLKALPEMETAGAPAIGARPATANDGVDITTWRSAGFSPVTFLAHLVGAGADSLVTGPGGFNGASGVEVWSLKRRKDGTTLLWELVGYLNAGNGVVVLNGKAAMFTVAAAAVGERLALAGSPSAGAPTYYFEPVEHMISETAEQG